MGVCEVCGYNDDSYRIEENDAVMRVCKLCHDGYLERMGLPPDADKPIEDVALTLDLSSIKEAGIDTEGMTGAELLQLKMELDERKKTRVPSLNEKQLDTLLTANEDDYKRVLANVRQREQRRKKRAAQDGDEDSGEDYQASEELLRSGEELQRVVAGLEKISEGEDMLGEPDESAAPIIAKIVAPHTDSNPAPEEDGGQEEEIPIRDFPAESELPPDGKEQEEPVETEEEQSDGIEPQDEIGAEEPAQNDEEDTQLPQSEDNATKTDNKKSEEPDMKKDAEQVTPKEETRGERVREKIRAAAHQSIDDERIQITSPEVALSKDKRPKTNFDVATSEYTGSVRFLDAFKYVMHRVSYTVLLALIVLAVSTVLFIESWRKGVIVLGCGAGAVGIGFLLMWYLSHCYEMDRRAQLLRIRQQEILFASMNSECYRELRTKFTVIKALGWLLNKLSVLLPLVTVVGGNIAGVILSFVLKDMYWLYPVVSVGASLAGVLVYYFTKFAADCTAYALDRERNQQIQQQTLLDILDELKKR